MAENINSFSRGLNKDASHINQPAETYTHATNKVQVSIQGDILSITNEKGTSVFSNSIPTGYKVCGATILDKDLILFLNNTSTNKSQIGIINRAGTYTRMVPSNSYSPSVAQGELDLGTVISINNPIDVQTRKLFSGERIVYFTDNEHPIGYINLDNPPISNILGTGRFIPFRQQPIITSIDLIDSPSDLTAGAYQFGFRYITAEGNVLNIGTISDIIPVGGNENYISRDTAINSVSYDGDVVDVQTGKQIQLNISNIDTTYVYIQIIAVRYTGSNNDLKTYVWRTLPVPATGTLTINYDGYNNEEELLLEDITQLGISYTTAKCVEQKDNRLFISNLKDNKEKYPINILADQIKVKYLIEEIDPTNDENYQNSNTSFKLKGFQRSEVYSLALAVIYKDGSRSYAYHIPAGYGNVAYTPNTLGPGGKLSANAITRFTGVYESSLTYSETSAATSPVYTIGDRLRHHIMPSINQEPHFESSTETIRVCSLEFDYATALSSFVSSYPTFLNDVEGFVFLRQPRVGIDENRSIYQQGIGLETMLSEFDFNFDTNPTQDSPNLCLKKLPMCGNFLFQTAYNGLKDGVNYADVITFTFGIDGDAQVPSYRQDETPGYVERNIWCRDLIYTDAPMMAFYSPESVLDNREAPPTGTILSKEAILSCSDSDISTDQELFYCDIGAGNEIDNGLKSSRLWAKFDYKTISTVSDNDDNVIKNSNLVSKNTNIPNVFNTPYTYVNTKSEGHLLLRLTDNPVPDYTLHDFTNASVINKATVNTGGLIYEQDSTGLASGDQSLTPINPVTKKDTSNYLYNIKKDNDSQYGSLKNADYIMIGYKSSPTVLDSTLQVFGGDIFITKFAVVNKGDYRVKVWESSGSDGYGDFDERADNGFTAQGLDLRGLMFFWVESTKNTMLRYNNGSVSYYPKVSYITHLGYDPEFVPDSRFYNTQYSFENKIQFFLPKVIGQNQSVADSYFTRTIYSEEDKFGQTGDTYRTILPNSFNDIPKNTGEIWDTFVYNNILFLHTTKSLWKTYVNQVAQQTTTIGQVSLGTGGLFEIPSQQIFTEKGGYGGTISQWGGSYTPFGYIFPDALQGKIFLLNENLQEISENGMIRYFNDNLSVISDTDTTYTDNPFNNNGLTSGYDYELKRWILSKNKSSGNFTISYSTVTNSFISFHNYNPSIYLSRDNDLFSLVNSESASGIKLHKHNVGDYGSFYGTVYPSDLTFVVNRASVGDKEPAYANADKTFDNLVIQMEVIDPGSGNIINPLRNSGDTIQVYNDRCNTGITNLIYTNTFNDIQNTRNSVFIRFKNEEYRLAIPLNAMNNSLPQKNADGTIINNNLSTTNLYRERMKGKYAIITLSFSNTQNLKNTINSILTTFRINAG